MKKLSTYAVRQFDLNTTIRIFVLGGLGLALSGCAATLADCANSSNVILSSQNLSLPFLQGCRQNAVSNGAVQSISCDDGRVGFIISDAAEPALAAMTQ